MVSYPQHAVLFSNGFLSLQIRNLLKSEPEFNPLLVIYLCVAPLKNFTTATPLKKHLVELAIKQGPLKVIANQDSRTHLSRSYQLSNSDNRIDTVFVHWCYACHFIRSTK